MDIDHKEAKSSHLKTLTILLCLVIVVAGLVYGIYRWQNNKLVSANAKIANLQTEASTLESQVQSISNKAKQTETSDCSGQDLSLTQYSSGGAAGTTGITYRVTNKSDQTCDVDGYPTVMLLDSSSQPIGQVAQNDGTQTGEVLTLKSSQSAYLTVLFPNAANFSGDQCSSKKSAYIEVTPPGQTTSVRTALSGQQYCPGFLTQAFSASAS